MPDSKPPLASPPDSVISFSRIADLRSRGAMLVKLPKGMSANEYMAAVKAGRSLVPEAPWIIPARD
jgi:hypothetical protein